MYTAREQLTEQQIREALDQCAQEPIHIPGSIQPHGLLVVLSEAMVIEQISANARNFLGMDAIDCLGRKLSEFIDEKHIQPLQNICVSRSLEPIQSITVTVEGKCYDAVAHKSGCSMIVELEPLEDNGIQNGFYYDQLRNFAIGMHKAHSLREVFGHVTECIRTITGFDRVKLYKFDQDWNGEVVAEARADYMPSYKGLHFPASDIPEQARKLYMQNYLRLIANTHYRPVPLVPVLNPKSGQAVDLSLSLLRSVSPVHIQYLENINVHASMSVSIIQNGQLWGLIACHHNTPLYVPYQARNVCEIMGHIFSAQLSTMEDFAKREAAEKREKLVKKLSTSLDKNTRIDQLMEESHTLASEALNADGIAIKTFVHILQYGDVPPADTVGKLIEWLNRRGEDIFHTNDASLYFKNEPQLEGLTGGILAVPISLKSHDYIIWFRNPIVKEVTWAGNPEKPFEQTVGGYRLTPRSSFALWKEQVRHRSEEWSAEDIRTATSVVSVLLESERLSAEHANLAKTEFLANISHEIRTPMNAVIGLARILSLSKPLTERQQEYIKTLQMSADGLLALINDMLDISKIESRSMELERIPFTMTKLLEEVISMLSVKAIEKGIAFHLDQKAVAGRDYLGDPMRIRQILLNLSSNAIKFTEAGTIDIIVHSEAAESPGLEKICITVRDTGVGIPEDKLDAIFHKFVQADSSISRKFGGTGLGLAITKMLTEAMGGTVTVKSKVGEGSQFVVCFYLQQAEPQAAVAKTPAAAKESVATHAPVLLVEDYEANILVATTYLEHMGYNYDVARSGLEAVDKTREKNYSVILMDVQMPDMNGFDATQMIREFEEKLPEKKHTPIIGMTAHALAGDRERCLGAGMDDYIAKPVSEDELSAKLKLYIKAA